MSETRDVRWYWTKGPGSQPLAPRQTGNPVPTVLRDGEWRLTYTGPTYGNYRVFDGWWKPADDTEAGTVCPNTRR